MVQTRATLLVDGVDYVWDFANRKAVPESHMPIGSARYQASEHARFQAFREHFREVLQAAASETDKAD